MLFQRSADVTFPIGSRFYPAGCISLRHKCTFRCTCNSRHHRQIKAQKDPVVLIDLVVDFGIGIIKIIAHRKKIVNGLYNRLGN